MKKSANARWRTLLMLLLALCVSTARGQQPSNPPVPPQPPVSTGPSGNQAPQEVGPKPAEQATLERRPLTGAEQFTLSRIGRKRSFLIGGIDVVELADTNVPISITETGLDSGSNFVGHFGVGRIGARYEFLTEYRGGGTIYAQQSALDTSFHNLSVQQRIAGRRWNFLLADQFGYLPVSGFGFFGYGATQGNLNSNVSSFNSLYLTSQDILTIRAPRISNSAVGELEHRFGRKSSFTASAGYNLLNSPGVGFVDNDGAVFMGTYNYKATARNTLALSYGYSLFRFPGQQQTISDHLLHVGYERIITRRWNLQLSGGPELYMFSGTDSANSRRLSWGQQSLLLYNMRRSNLDFSYSTYLSGGSGVLPGAQTHDARITLGRQWSRKWSSSVDLGFGRSTALSQTAPQNAKQAAYQAWYGNGIVARALGRHAQLFLTYGVQLQASDSGPCTVAICSSTPARHFFGLGVGWHLEPAGAESNSNFGIR